MVGTGAEGSEVQWAGLHPLLKVQGTRQMDAGLQVEKPAATLGALGGGRRPALSTYSCPTLEGSTLEPRVICVLENWSASLAGSRAGMRNPQGELGTPFPATPPHPTTILRWTRFKKEKSDIYAQATWQSFVNCTASNACVCTENDLGGQACNFKGYSSKKKNIQD